MPKVTIEVPATTANLGPGFDCVGLALGLSNTIRAETVDAETWEVSIRGLGEGELPVGADNLAVRAIRRLFAEVADPPAGIRLEQHNRVPLCSGLGSSSSAIVGGLVAANELCGRPLDRRGLLCLAAELEGHPDNVAPALLGGLVVVVTEGPELHYVRFDPPDGVAAVIATPAMQLSTERARRALPDHYPKADAVFNVGRSALLVAALLAGAPEALRAALHDRVHQPYRLPLIPGAEAVIEAAREAGALGAVISGAGPTLLAFCAGETEAVVEAMGTTWERYGTTADVRPVALSAEGAHVVA